MAVLDSDPTALPEPDGGATPASGAADAAAAPSGASSSDAALDPAVAALCVPIAGADPCGPDLDFDGDAAYLNFFASAEGILPSSFFIKDPNDKSADDAKPFDRASIDLPSQIEAMKPLLERTCDLRLLSMRARLLILNRDIGGFAVTLAAIAEWLDKFWDAVHPRPQGDDLAARAAALAALDFSTVVFPLQYAPLFEARRIGPVTYRAWVIATGEAKPRTGEQKLPTSALAEAVALADPAVLAAARKHVAMLKVALGRISNAFAIRGGSCGLENLPTLVQKISEFIDPLAVEREQATAEAQADGADAETSKKDGVGVKAAGAMPVSLAQAKDALAAIADYYGRFEPSSPTLPLVRQAHQLVGKSFIEVMSILVPTHMDKAAFQIGAEQVFELPVGKLSNLSANAGAGAPAVAATEATGAEAPRFQVDSRSQAVALLEQVQRFFRQSEPSSPVPMLCERARAFAERDFMAVLRDVLPKAALKNIGADK
jgi:type VI secretion system protein ImpA